MASAATCALPGQNTPQGYCNVERLLKAVIHCGGLVKARGTCYDARGLKAVPPPEGRRDIHYEADLPVDGRGRKVLTF